MNLAWGLWIAYFIAVEGTALYRHRTQDTFSWQVWSDERKAPVLKWLIAGGLGWLAAHFFFGA